MEYFVNDQKVVALVLGLFVSKNFLILQNAKQVCRDVYVRIHYSQILHALRQISLFHHTFFYSFSRIASTMKKPLCCFFVFASACFWLNEDEVVSSLVIFSSPVTCAVGI